MLVTTSLGFLKENHEKFFDPLLPHHLRLGIESLGFGLINKIFLKFDQVWWKPGTKGFQFIWRKEMESNINSNEKLASWTKFLTGFDILEEEKNGVLLGWIGGRGAHIMETLNEQQVAQDCLKLLQVFLRRNDIPFPRQCFRTRWYNNKFVRGAYSHITSKCDKNGISPASLREPVWGFYPADSGMKVCNIFSNIIIKARENCLFVCVCVCVCVINFEIIFHRYLLILKLFFSLVLYFCSECQ